MYIQFNRNYLPAIEKHRCMNTVAQKMLRWYRVVHKWKFATVSLERAKCLLICLAKTHLLRICDFERKTSGYAMVVQGHPKTPKNTSFLGVTQPPGDAEPLYSRGHN